MKRILELLAVISLTIFQAVAQQSTNYTGAVINKVAIIGPTEKEVSITTNVATERIIDGIKLGVCDTATYKLRFGDHMIELTAEGYLPIREKIRISPQSAESYTFNLEVDPKTIPQTIMITTNVETSREIDKINYEPAVSAQYELSNGRHTVKLKADGYVTKTRLIQVKKGNGKNQYSYRLYRVPDEWEHFVLFNYAGSHVPQHSFGFTYGQVKRWGWYVNMMLGTGFHYHADYDYIYGLIYTGKASQNRISFTGGGVFRITEWAGIYAGMGYGYRSLTWETIKGSWCLKYSDASPLHGASMEAGLLVNIRGIVITAGISSIFSGNGGFPEAKLGVGYMFKK